jgi:hypothetical protein
MFQEEAPKGDVTLIGVAMAMKARTKEKTAKLIIELEKMAIVANPNLKRECLQEISI